MPALRLCVPSFSPFEKEAGMYLVLGGGTVLASRWHHRVSTDLDLFLYAPKPSALRYIEYVAAVLENMPQVERIQVASYHLSFEVADTPVSLFTATSLTGESAVEHESETGVLLDSSLEIMAKKVMGRMFELGDFLERDMYDLCVASHRVPDLSDSLWKMVPEQQKAQLADELKKLARQTMRMSGRPVVEPKYPYIAKHVWSCGETLVRTGSIPSHFFTTEDDEHGLSR